MKQKRISIFSLALLGLTACGVTGSMDQMKNDTSKMSGNMDEMKGDVSTTNSKLDRMIDLQEKELLSKIREQLEIMRSLYVDGRMGASTELRGKFLYEWMQKADSLPQKIAHAAVYFSSFEFQLVKNDDWDDEQKQQRLYLLGLKEFFLAFQGFLGKAKGDFGLPVTDDLKNLYAIAIALHMVNPVQEDLVLQGKLPVAKNMLSLIMEGLSGKSLYESGLDREGKEKSREEFPGYIRAVIANEGLAVKVLQVRMNAMVATLIPDLVRLGVPSSPKDLAEEVIQNFALDPLKLISERKIEWHPDFSKLNNEEIYEMADRVLSAYQAEMLLIKLGYPVEFSSLLRLPLSLMNVKKYPLVGVSRKTMLKNAAILKLQGALGLLLYPDGKGSLKEISL